MGNLEPNQLPQHIAIIPDGNRRWAQERGLPASEGHRAGSIRIEELITTAQKMGIKTITIWGFSTENWKREKTEVDVLFKLFMRMLRRLVREANQRNIRIRHFGRKDRLPSIIITYLKKLEQSTSKNTQYNLNYALDYGGRDEILRAVKKIVDDGIPSDQINEELFSQYLDTGNLPDPDLIIRTSGEQRISGLMPWQGSYAEYYFSPSYLPDFSDEEFIKAIKDFGRRDRRFGGNTAKAATA
jgi:undecaprenyl diphosphate synthase